MFIYTLFTSKWVKVHTHVYHVNAHHVSIYFEYMPAKMHIHVYDVNVYFEYMLALNVYTHQHMNTMSCNEISPEHATNALSLAIFSVQMHVSYRYSYVYENTHERMCMCTHVQADHQENSD